MILKEAIVEKHVRQYLKGKGWVTTNLPKSVGVQGVDITAWHPKWRKLYLIEIKGEGNSFQMQVKHSAFYNLIGQIISRMDKEGNAVNRARFYALGIPKKWEKTFKAKIAQMKYGWKLLKLKVFLVEEDGSVEEKPYSYFLK